AGTLELKVGPSRKPLEGVMSLIPTGPRDDDTIRDAIDQYARAVAAGQEDDFAATSVLKRERPRIAGASLPSSRADVEGITDAIRRMDRTHLVIQGPPGTGKTYTSAQAIVTLLADGKRVGIASMAHKAINNLLKCVEDVAKERGVSFRGVKKSTTGDV